MTLEFDHILLVGCGNMAGAMLEGWLAGGLDPARFTAIEPSDKPTPEGVARHRAVPEAGHFDAILLGVKPQMLDAVTADVARLAGPDTTILSLLAGVELATLARALPARSRA